MLIQYDSDGLSSNSTHTESDDSSIHSGTPSPVEPSPSGPQETRCQTSVAVPDSSRQFPATGVLEVNGNSPQGCDVAPKKRSSNGKSPVDKKKAKGGNERGFTCSNSTLVNLNDTISTMPQLRPVRQGLVDKLSPVLGNPPRYPVYSSPYTSFSSTTSQYTAAGVAQYALPNYPVPSGSLNFPPGHPPFSTSLPQYFTGGVPRPPGCGPSPRGFFPQWRNSYAQMQCQTPFQPSYDFAKCGNKAKDGFR